MTDDRIDLGPLDPSRDPDRWEAMVRDVTARALAARARPRTVGAQLGAWARPVLAMAAAAAIAAWLPALFADRRATRGDATADRTDPAMALVTWAERGELPATADVLGTLGADDAER